MPEENVEPLALTIEKIKLAWAAAEKAQPSGHNLQKLLGNFRVAYHHIGQTLSGGGDEKMEEPGEDDK